MLKFTAIQVEKMDEALGTWSPCGRATGTRFKADRLQKGKTYKFRVKAVNAEGSSAPLENANGVEAKNPFGMQGRIVVGG